jgi:type II secretory ATPase GspE/PulE/Tfp pilus assembly ATPase PilB-like protein
MLRVLQFIAIAGTVIQSLLPLLTLQASAQETGDYDATCYLRIEGRTTQDVSRLCGKKINRSDSKPTQDSPAVRSAQPLSVIDSTASDDDESEAVPAPRASIPSTRFPSSATPVARPPVAAPSGKSSPTPLPNRVIPDQTPNSDPDLLPVPKLPENRQPQPAKNRRVTAKLKPRSQPQKQTITALQPPPIQLQPPPPTQSQPPPPRSTLKLRPSVPVALPSPRPPITQLRPQAPTAKPQMSPSEALLQHLLAQKYVYLFWVLFLQVPLLKVAIDQRSRPKAPKRRSQTRPLDVATKTQPQLSNELDAANGDQSAAGQTAVAIATPVDNREPENITQAAEYHLSQADNQIAQIKVLLTSAVRNRVSDIHLEPTSEGLRVRYRIDGILRDVTMLPLAVSRRTIVALKVMADMDISESRRPQDARISEQYTSATATNLDLDLRVSTLPCVGGEKAVIRLLPRQNPFSKMDELGFTPKALALYKSWLQQPQGMIIFTGPTGSGKTSTLYTSLQAIATEHVNVVTVEDPVEYILPCITQTQVHETAGMTFPAGLRAILRQDPDIIMVGEIRDSETAETAVRAALTGHLVLTTLHTNDAIGAIPRLKDVGPDPGLISDALLGVVAQRLVRRVCPHCAAPYTPTEADLQTLGLQLAEANAQAWRHGQGCSHCFHSGYLGREAIIELLHVDATVRQLIYEGSLAELTNYLYESQFESFRKAAIAKVTTGVTTVAEVRRILPASKLTSSASTFA